jgi:hypothetical protein
MDGMIYRHFILNPSITYHWKKGNGTQKFGLRNTARIASLIWSLECRVQFQQQNLATKSYIDSGGTYINWVTLARTAQQHNENRNYGTAS